jgi:hypothetical protein
MACIEHSFSSTVYNKQQRYLIIGLVLKFQELCVVGKWMRVSVEVFGFEIRVRSILIINPNININIIAAESYEFYRTFSTQK